MKRLIIGATTLLAIQLQAELINSWTFNTTGGSGVMFTSTGPRKTVGVQRNPNAKTGTH